MMIRTDGAPAPLYTRAPRSPWWEIIRRRWSARQDRALVLRGRDGLLHLHGAREPRPPGAPGPVDPATAVHRSAPVPAALGGYDSAYHVRLDEHPATRVVALPTVYGTEPVDLQVMWWAHDPVQVVRNATIDGWPEVRKDLDQRIRALESHRAAQSAELCADDLAAELAVPWPLHEAGITYRVTGAHDREMDGELRLGRSGGGTPNSWTPHHREEYAFCLEAVTGGPAALAALWLLRHPDQVSQVLDWSVGHQNLLRAPAGWQDEMAGLLGHLTEQERAELSHLVRDRLLALGRRVPPARTAPPSAGTPGGAHPTPGRPG
ncbi:hypothetical protein ABT354_01950 [Streptomyces sp. NPDC000594]|uniref:hypothetical protein n=1 Tax=Streptomyces sp. NPDC000594 TaxID=3154261 RepID=UPI003332B03C